MNKEEINLKQMLIEFGYSKKIANRILKFYESCK
jgi:hypothetical protein